ncbi:hypothetical protein D3C76_488640 [compost metagenome]
MRRPLASVHRQSQSQQRGDAEDRDRQQRQQLLQAVDELVAEQRHQEAQATEQSDVAAVAERARAGNSLSGQQRVADEKAQVDEHHEQQRHDGTEYAELSTTLDHLRDTQAWTLGGMRSHEDRADQRAEQNRQCTPEQVEP